jgi:hypothetical protein
MSDTPRVVMMFNGHKFGRVLVVEESRTSVMDDGCTWLKVRQAFGDEIPDELQPLCTTDGAYMAMPRGMIGILRWNISGDREKEHARVMEIIEAAGTKSPEDVADMILRYGGAESEGRMSFWAGVVLAQVAVRAMRWWRRSEPRAVRHASEKPGPDWREPVFMVGQTDVVRDLNSLAAQVRWMTDEKTSKEDR